VRASMFAIRTTFIAAFLVAMVLVAVPTGVHAKTVGLILPKDCAFSPDTKEKFGAILRSKGISGKDLEIFMQRPGSDKVSRLNSIRKFLAIGSDVIVVWGGTSLKEIASEAGKTPIVFVGAWDPVKSGIIKDLKAPGKNVTGVVGKTSMPYLIDNIIETVNPKALGVIYHSEVIDSMAQYDDLKKVAAEKGLDLLAMDAKGLTPAAASKTLAPAEFLYLAQGCAVEGGVYTSLSQLNKPAATQNPGVSGGGVVFTLAPDMDETIKVAAEITASILNGKKPGEIPVARIKKINFVINLGEAKKLGLTIPFPVLKRGTEVIR
jgi:putative ABC transport system substrate-binding protein